MSVPQAAEAPNFLSPEVPGGLPLHEVPLVAATPESLKGYGEVVSERDARPIEIVRWPAQGRRPVDPDTGDEGGTTEGVFEAAWRGDVLYGRNEAVGGHYVLGWSRDPAEASETAAEPARGRVLLWHANYHPDGGQLFFPLDGKPFVVPAALPGDEVRPEDFVAFYSDGSVGIYIHPNIWHEGVFPVGESVRTFDRQGRVHARVSCDFAREFGCLLSVPLREP